MHNTTTTKSKADTPLFRDGTIVRIRSDVTVCPRLKGRAWSLKLVSIVRFRVTTRLPFLVVTVQVGVETLR